MWQKEIEVSIPDYQHIWGLALDTYQLHMRYILLDTVTGYRSQYHSLSTLGICCQENIVYRCGVFTGFFRLIEGQLSKHIATVALHHHSNQHQLLVQFFSPLKQEIISGYITPNLEFKRNRFAPI